MRAKGPTIRRGESSGEHGTPWPFIDACQAKFGPIMWDLAATIGNRKAPHYFDKEEDSLVQQWHGLGGLLWLNPPFANITVWAKKCSLEMIMGAEILLLVPGSIGSNWYWRHVEPFAKVYSVGRMIFEGSKDVYPKDLILCHYSLSNYHHGERIERMERWLWQNEVTGTSTSSKSVQSVVTQ